MKELKYIFLFAICFSAVLALPSLVRGPTGPAKNIKGWAVKEINEPTKVWQVAQEAAGGEFNIQGVRILIEEKNPWLKERNYALSAGDQVLVPMFTPLQ